MSAIRFGVFFLIVIALFAYVLWWTKNPKGSNKPQKTKLHLMVDLETASLANNAYIRAIGACFFDAHGVSTQFYESCDGPEQEGSHVDLETIKWWETQTLEAKAALLNPKGVTLNNTLHNLRHWIEEEMKVFSMKGDRSDVEVWVWGNGADFDPVILANAYKRCGIELPWRWFNVRCYRTLKNVFRNIRPDEFEGEKHTALADALNQARHASKILRHVYY